MTVPRPPTEPIYSYVRNFKGVIGYKTSPGSSSTKDSVMGAHADDYFSAHGYQPGTVRLIQKAYEEAEEAGVFVDRVSKEGIPIAEAQYMYNLIHNS
jgi:nucleotide-binding universal stress UspA family protein